MPADSYEVWESSRALCSIIPADSDTEYESNISLIYPVFAF